MTLEKSWSNEVDLEQQPWNLLFELLLAEIKNADDESANKLNYDK
jgi:hypothetical protein